MVPFTCLEYHNFYQGTNTSNIPWGTNAEPMYLSFMEVLF